MRKRVHLLNICKKFSFLIKLVILVDSVCLLLSSCKAQSSIDINLNPKLNNSGSFNLNIKLDDEAASILRGDSYKPIDLSDIFQTNELEKSSFKIKQKDNTFSITRSFSNKLELQKIFDLLFGENIINLDVKSDTSMINSRRDIKLKLNLSKIHDIYLSNDKIKKSLSENGVEYSDYELLINKAFKSTTLEFKITDELTDATASSQLSGSNLKDTTLTTTGSKLRKAFLLGNIGALLSLCIAFYLIYQKSHTIKIVSKHE